MTSYLSGWAFRYYRASSTTFSDGTVIDDSVFGRASTVYYFNYTSATLPSDSSVVPRLVQDATPAMFPALNYAVMIAAINGIGVGPYCTPVIAPTLESGIACVVSHS